MHYATLEALTIKINRIEERKPNTYNTDKEWVRLCQKRDIITHDLMVQKLEYLKTKKKRLEGYDCDDVEKSIKQCETYLQNHEIKGVSDERNK